MPSEPAVKPRRFRSALALGARLSVAGWVPKISIGIAVLTVFGAIVVAASLSRSPHPPLASVPGLTATFLAWGGAFTFAVAAAAHAFDHDVTSGIRDLARVRGLRGHTYVLSRVLGLALSLFLIVSIGALVTGGACTLLAPGSRLVVLKTTAATIPYAAAYAIVIAPLAVATMGTRSRPRGYLLLLAIVIVPELVQGSLEVIPEHWRSLVGVPSAMATLRDALTPAHYDAPLAGAATAVIALVAIAAIGFTFEAASHAARTEISA